MNLAVKLVSMGAVAASGFLATKIADKSWTSVTGNEPPKGEASVNSSIVQVAAFAVLSAIIAALVQRYVMKGTNRLLAMTGKETKPEA